jgi:putative DNA primase/helicase
MKAGDRFNKGGPDMISDVFGITNELPQKVEQAGKPKFLFKPMSDVPIRPVFWLWENRFPEGKLIGICGPEDVGKTILECEIAAILTSKDRCWPDGTKPQYTYDVTMMASEDSYEDTIKPRLLAAGANMDRIRYLDMERNSFSLDKDLSKLEEHLKVYPNNVVFISPLYNFVSDRVRTNDTGNMQRVLGPVSRAADRSGSTVFCNLHFNKNTDARAGDRIMGARGTGASFRAAWGVVVNPDDKDERLLLKISNRLAPSSQPGWRFKIKGKTVEQYDPKSGTTIFARNTAYIEWIEEDDRDIDAVLQERKAGQKQDKAMRFLSDLLADGPVLSTDAEKAVADAKFSESTIKRAKRELGVHSKKQGLVWYWCYRK